MSKTCIWLFGIVLASSDLINLAGAQGGSGGPSEGGTFSIGSAPGSSVGGDAAPISFVVPESSGGGISSNGYQVPINFSAPSNPDGGGISSNGDQVPISFSAPSNPDDTGEKPNHEPSISFSASPNHETPIISSASYDGTDENQLPIRASSNQELPISLSASSNPEPDDGSPWGATLITDGPEQAVDDGPGPSLPVPVNNVPSGDATLITDGPEQAVDDGPGPSLPVPVNNVPSGDVTLLTDGQQGADDESQGPSLHGSVETLGRIDADGLDEYIYKFEHFEKKVELGRNFLDILALGLCLLLIYICYFYPENIESVMPGFILRLYVRFIASAEPVELVHISRDGGPVVKVAVAESPGKREGYSKGQHVVESDATGGSLFLFPGGKHMWALMDDLPRRLPFSGELPSDSDIVDACNSAAEDTGKTAAACGAFFLKNEEDGDYDVKLFGLGKAKAIVFPPAGDYFVATQSEHNGSGKPDVVQTDSEIFKVKEGSHIMLIPSEWWGANAREDLEIVQYLAKALNEHDIDTAAEFLCSWLTHTTNNAGFVCLAKLEDGSEWVSHPAEMQRFENYVSPKSAVQKSLGPKYDFFLAITGFANEKPPVEGPWLKPDPRNEDELEPCQDELELADMTPPDEIDLEDARLVESEDEMQPNAAAHDEVQFEALSQDQPENEIDLEDEFEDDEFEEKEVEFEDNDEPELADFV